MARDKPIYSASVVDRAMIAWSCEAHKMGIPQNISTYPCLDCAVLGSIPAISGSQLPAKSASTYKSREHPLGLRISPLSCVPLRYFPIYFTACLCSIFGSAANLAHWCTA